MFSAPSNCGIIDVCSVIMCARVLFGEPNQRAPAAAAKIEHGFTPLQRLANVRKACLEVDAATLADFDK